MFGLSFTFFGVTASPAQSHSLLWEVSGKGLEKPSYLFGTIHLICQGDFVPGDSLKAALNATDHLLLELDMTDPELMASAMKSMLMKDNKTLSDFLSPGEYTRVAKFFRDSAGFDIALMAGVKPFLLSSVVFTNILNCPTESVEERLTNLSKAAGSGVGGLETPGEQAAIFDSIPYDKQAKLIVNLIDSLPRAKEHFRKTLELYKEQDIEKMYTSSADNSFDLVGFEDIMLTQRNRKWIPSIEASARKQPTFVAVGAAHLGGEEGIVQLLRRRGYTVRPIPNTL